jgi:hypothetical protein
MPIRQDDREIGYLVQLVNHILQILALIVAGVWGVWTWYRSTEPAIRENVQCEVAQEVEWRQLSEACAVTFRVTVKNLGLDTANIYQANYGIFSLPTSVTSARLAPNEQIKVLDQDPQHSELLAKYDLKHLSGSYDPHTDRKTDIAVLFRPSATLRYAFELQLVTEASKLYRCDTFYEFLPCEAPNILKEKDYKIPISKRGKL